jgi:hypothetical protein
MFHGLLIRHRTSGQLPISMLMSEDNGKAQGKSDTAKGVLWMVSTKGNKFNPSIDVRTILKV